MLGGDEPVHPTSDIAGFEQTVGDHFASTLAMARLSGIRTL